MKQQLSSALFVPWSVLLAKAIHCSAGWLGPENCCQGNGAKGCCSFYFLCVNITRFYFQLPSWCIPSPFKDSHSWNVFPLRGWVRSGFDVTGCDITGCVGGTSINRSATIPKAQGPAGGTRQKKPTLDQWNLPVCPLMLKETHVSRLWVLLTPPSPFWDS